MMLQFYFTVTCMCEYMSVGAWEEVGRHLVGAGSLLYHVGLGDRTQVISVGSWHLHLLSHVTAQCCRILTESPHLGHNWLMSAHLSIWAATMHY